MNNDWRDYELTHHGILGMHWGIRRYQNPDGSLTEAGKERYGTRGNYEAKKAHAKQVRRNVANTMITAAYYVALFGSIKMLMDANRESKIQRIGRERFSKVVSSIPRNSSVELKDLTMGDLEKLDLW